MMNLDPGALSLGAAFVAGLAASGHCIGMCGGIAGALAMRSQQASQGSRIALAFAYNLSRVASYALAGAIAGLLGRTLLRAVDVAPLSIAFRVLAGLIMLAAAGRLLFGWRLLDPLESAGSGLWRRIAPWAGRQGRSGGLGGAIGLGLAFGAGTLPSMVTATVAFEKIARSLASRATLRNIAGGLLLAFGLWTAGQAVYSGVMRGSHGQQVQPGGHQHH